MSVDFSRLSMHIVISRVFTKVIKTGILLPNQQRRDDDGNRISEEGKNRERGQTK